MKNKFWKKHSVFISLTVMLIPAVLIIARYSTWPSILPFLTMLNGPVPEDPIPYDLAIGYAACYVFFLIQVEIPQLRKEKKAYISDIRAHHRKDTENAADINITDKINETFDDINNYNGNLIDLLM